MIKANELRIGNFVNLQYKDGTIERIVFDFEMGWNMEYINPIPLTEEWLLKFGFECIEFDDKHNQYRYIDRLIVIRDNVFTDYGTSVKLDSVHTLQNLYFALTNTELKLKNE